MFFFQCCGEERMKKKISNHKKIYSQFLKIPLEVNFSGCSSYLLCTFIYFCVGNFLISPEISCHCHSCSLLVIIVSLSGVILSFRKNPIPKNFPRKKPNFPKFSSLLLSRTYFFSHGPSRGHNSPIILWIAVPIHGKYVTSPKSSFIPTNLAVFLWSSERTLPRLSWFFVSI